MNSLDAISEAETEDIMGCGVMPDGSYECASKCDCGLSWVWQRAPELDKRIGRGDDFAGDAWKHISNGKVHYVSVGVTPKWVENHDGPNAAFVGNDDDENIVCPNCHRYWRPVNKSGYCDECENDICEDVAHIMHTDTLIANTRLDRQEETR